MTATDWTLIGIAGVQALTMIILVCVTIYYAVQTRKMAKETLNQRYDTFRPVIDIERDFGGHDQISEVLATEKQDYPYGISCILDNIGVGSAIDVYSYGVIDKKSRGCILGTIKVGDNKRPFTLSSQQMGNRRFLVAYYRDIYGRFFESKREVIADKEGPSWRMGTLKHRKLDKIKDSKIIREYMAIFRIRSKHK